jgi:hypothetical protein
MNREIYPATLYPVTGDVQSTPGNAQVVVVGIQHIPVLDATMSGGEVLEYNLTNNQWEPKLRGVILVDGLVVSDDYWISVDVASPITIDGV